METSKYEKKRGRIRKKIEQMRNGTTVLDTPSPCSSLSEGLDIFPESPPQVCSRRPDLIVSQLSQRLETAMEFFVRMNEIEIGFSRWFSR
jgi:hypothetical protein